MSHYTVAVIHRKDQDIAELLKPYDENLEVEPYIKYTKEEAIKWAKDNFKPGRTDDEYYEIMADGRQTDEEGNIYSTYNPDAKWDWYEVGGRWSDLLSHKETREHSNELPIKDIYRAPGLDTYAVVTPDGVWHAPGRMGWWGISSETEEEARVWSATWAKRWLDDQDQDLIMTIVDCHI